MTHPSNEILCPNCPKCGSVPPWIWPGLAQCMCPNEDCDVFMWTPRETAQANLSDMHPVLIEETPAPAAE